MQRGSGWRRFGIRRQQLQFAYSRQRIQQVRQGFDSRAVACTCALCQHFQRPARRQVQFAPNLAYAQHEALQPFNVGFGHGVLGIVLSLRPGRNHHAFTANSRQRRCPLP